METATATAKGILLIKSYFSFDDFKLIFSNSLKHFSLTNTSQSKPEISGLSDIIRDVQKSAHAEPSKPKKDDHIESMNWGSLVTQEKSMDFQEEGKSYALT